MALIDTNGLIGRIQRITGCNFIRANEVVEASPTVPAIPIERIKQLREEMRNIKDFDVVNGGLYVREFDVVELIDAMIKEYEGGE